MPTTLLPLHQAVSAFKRQLLVDTLSSFNGNRSRAAAALGMTDTAGVTVSRGAGCGECRGTGYRGRTGIYELLRLTEDARELILARAAAGALRRHAIARGMTTLREDAWAKAGAGVTTVAEIVRVTQEDDLA
jgi:type II secretory ATPase GspE/PulE/Tfp pilus assembly ATPase PilB-like protein